MRERWSDSYCVSIFRPLSPCKYPPYYPHIINAKKITFDGGKLCAPFARSLSFSLCPFSPVRPLAFSVNRSPLSFCLILRPYPIPKYQNTFPNIPLFLSFPVRLSPFALYMSYIHAYKKGGLQNQKFFIYL